MENVSNTAQKTEDGMTVTEWEFLCETVTNTVDILQW